MSCCCEPNIFNSEEDAEPMASSRFNSDFGAGFQAISPLDPNPSYLNLSNIAQGIYDYDNNLGFWTLTNPTTITINHTGYYNVGLNIICFQAIVAGSAVFQIHNLVQGAIGTVPPISNCQVILANSPAITPGFFVGTESCFVNANLAAGSQIQVAYITDVDASISPTSCISITLLEGTPGPQGLPGPAGVGGGNIYNIDGLITDPLRTVSLGANDLKFAGLAGSELEIETPIITLDSANINLPQVPTIDNTQLNLLVRDSITGQIEQRTVASLPTNTNIYNSNGTLTSARLLQTLGNNLTFEIGNNRFNIDITLANMMARFDGAAGVITLRPSSFLSIETVDARLTTIPTTNNLATDFLVRDVVNGTIQRRTFDSFDNLDFSFVADAGSITTLNRFHYCNTVNYFDTADNAVSIGAMDRFATGWVTFFTNRPSRIDLTVEISPMSSLAPVNLAAASIAVDLYYVNPTLVQRVAGTAILVVGQTFTLGVDFGSNISLTPPFYPGAVGNSQWTVLIRNPNANNFNLVGHIKFFKG